MDRRRVVVLAVLLVAVGLGGLAALAAGATVGGAIAAALFLPVGILTVRQALHPRPLLVLDDRGIKARAAKVDLPWSVLVGARHQALSGVTVAGGVSSRRTSHYLVLRAISGTALPKRRFPKHEPDEALVDMTALRCDYDAVAAEARRRIVEARGGGP